MQNSTSHSLKDVKHQYPMQLENLIPNSRFEDHIYEQNHPEAKNAITNK